MTKVLDDAAIERAFRAAERALAEGDPDTLAGRFSPRLSERHVEAPAPTLPVNFTATRR